VTSARTHTHTHTHTHNPEATRLLSTHGRIAGSTTSCRLHVSFVSRSLAAPLTAENAFAFRVYASSKPTLIVARCVGQIAADISPLVIRPGDVLFTTAFSAACTSYLPRQHPAQMLPQQRIHGSYVPSARCTMPGCSFRAGGASSLNVASLLSHAVYVHVGGSSRLAPGARINLYTFI